MFKKIINTLFGKIKWDSPNWMKFCFQKIKTFFILKKATIIFSSIFLISSTFLILGGYLIYNKWLKPVEPEKISATISAPVAKSLDMENDIIDSLEIYFEKSVAKLEDLNSTNLTKGIKIFPEIKGEWSWQGDKLLVFAPSFDWPVGKEYTIEIDKSFVAKHIHLKKYKYTFKTEPFKIKFSKFEFYQDPIDPKIKKVVANLKFNYPVDPNTLENKIKFELIRDNKKVQEYDYTINYNSKHSEAYIHTENMEIPDLESEILLTINNGISSSLGGSPTEEEIEDDITIPGMDTYFSIENIKTTFIKNKNFKSEQAITIKTTADVKGAEIAKNIDIWLLPVDKPATEFSEKKENYYWYSPLEIGQDILETSQEIKHELLKNDKPHSDLHILKIQAPVNRYIYVRIKKGTTAFGGYKLTKNSATILYTPEYPKIAKVMNEGSVLSISGEKQLNIVTVGLKAIRVKFARIRPDQINHLITQTKGEFQKPEFKSSYFSEEDISKVFSEVHLLDENDLTNAQYVAIDFNKYLKEISNQLILNRGIFYLTVEGFDPITKQSINPQDIRLVILTDLGVIAKQDAYKNHNVFVQSISSGTPVKNAVVEILGKNGLPILSRSTKETGKASFPNLENFKNEKEPIAYIVKHGTDIAFLPMHKYDRELELSKFDIGGTLSSGKENSLKAYLFSDRGIYRPGEEFHIGLIAKTRSWQFPVNDIPLQIVIYDPRGKEIFKEHTKLSETGFIETSYKTEENSPTGRYMVDAYIAEDENQGSFLGSTYVRVEEFLPDRLRIKANFNPSRMDGWVDPSNLLVEVNLNTLFGTAAANRKISGKLILTPQTPYFKSFEDYTFFDYKKAEQGYTEELENTQTDENGIANFSLNLNAFKDATYRLTFITQGFEAEAGRGVSTIINTLVSPRAFLIGAKADGSLDAIQMGSRRNLDFIAIDSEINPIQLDDLKLEIIEESYVSVLVRQPDGTYAYQTEKKENIKQTKDISISDKGLKYLLPTKNPGNFICVLKDKDKNEIFKQNFSIIGEANLTANLEKNALLQIKLDKKIYNPEDTITVQVKAPYTGAGLITIEQDKIYTYKWFKTKTTTAVEKIQLPKDIEANGYINVTFVRDINSDEIYTSPLSYGVAPFSISKKHRKLDLTLNVNKKAKPGETLEIEYATSKTSQIVIFAVDEGILQAGGYKTPDPLKLFLSKRALEVSSKQILDLILPEYRFVKNHSKEGGGDSFEESGINLNPFKRKREKPVVFWSGILESTQDPKKITYNIPDYFNGTIRTMAVAVSNNEIGVNSSKSIIQGPFVITPNIPTFVTPDDTFTISFGIANNIEGSGENAKVKLEIKTSNHLEVLESKSKEIIIPEKKEGVETFSLKALNLLGSATIDITATFKDKKIKNSVDLSIRPASTYITTLKTGYIKNNAKELIIDRDMYPHFRKMEVSLSPLPLILAKGLVTYLKKFPYGCTEQIVSQTIPALILGNQGLIESENTSSIVERTLRILQSRQNQEGAFGFWAANSYVSIFQNIYAMQFITEASEKGYYIPENLKRDALGFLNQQTSSPITSLSDARERAYALYIFARNGLNAYSALTELEEYLADKDIWKKDITILYLAAIYKLLQDNKKAQNLIFQAKWNIDIIDDYNNYYDTTFYLSNYIYIIAKHFPEHLSKIDIDLIKELSKKIQEQRYNTISSASIIYGLKAYANAVEETISSYTDKVKIYEIDKDNNEQLLNLNSDILSNTIFSDHAKKIKIKSETNLPLFYQLTLAGFDKTLSQETTKQRIEIFKDFEDSEGNKITEAKLGKTIYVHLKLRALEDNYFYNIAVVDLLPGGFEPVIGTGDPVERILTPDSTWQADYADVRDDRVILFGSVDQNTSEIIYPIRATNRGEFSIAGSSAKSMYDQSINAISKGGKIKIQGQ